MSYLLFVDESGSDHNEGSYEVLAGVAIEDRRLWGLVQALQDAEIEHFGRRYSAGRGELKAKKVLKSKSYRQAEHLPPLDPEERRRYAERCLANGAAAGVREVTALSQAKIAYAQYVFELCNQFGCRMFASILLGKEPFGVNGTYLRNDYSCLFQQFFYYLEDIDLSAFGIVVFDELEKSRSHLLVDQMDQYFKGPTNGKASASQLLPEPLFVHSDLTTGIQVADLLAYILSWGFRTTEMTKPARGELADLVNAACLMRHETSRLINGRQQETSSFAVIPNHQGIAARETKKAM